MFGIQSKTTWHAKWQGNANLKEGNNQSFEIYPELTRMLKLAEKDSKTVITNIFHMFKKLSKNMEDIKKTQNEVLEKKMTMSKDKNYTSWD